MPQLIFYYLNALLIANETLTTLALNADGFNLDYTDEDGVLSQVDLSTVIDGFETLTALTVDAAAGELTNACVNGVACNEVMHQSNRRSEFVIIK